MNKHQIYHLCIFAEELSRSCVELQIYASWRESGMYSPHRHLSQQPEPAEELSSAGCAHAAPKIYTVYHKGLMLLRTVVERVILVRLPSAVYQVWSFPDPFQRLRLGRLGKIRDEGSGILCPSSPPPLFQSVYTPLWGRIDDGEYVPVKKGVHKRPVRIEDRVTVWQNTTTWSG